MREGADGAKNGDRPLCPRGARDAAFFTRSAWSPWDRVGSPHVFAAVAKGFTLIELMISITLVAALATGMLMAMRTSLLSLEKINSRLQFNRRVMGMETDSYAADRRRDAGDERLRGAVRFFWALSDSLRLVSSYSMAEGARGYPQFDEFRVVKGEEGLRLVVTEHLYTGPSSTAPFCGGEQSVYGCYAVVVDCGGPAGELALFPIGRRCRTRLLRRSGWPVWDRPDLPAAVKIEMTPLDSSAALLPVMNVTVPIRITRQMRSWYEDRPSRRGSALLTVLWLSACLAAIAFSVSSSVRSETDRVEASSNGLRAWYLATGAVERGIQWMLWGEAYRNPDGSPSTGSSARRA